MALRTDERVSAQVVLKPAGKPGDPTVPITSRNLPDLAPAGSDAQAAVSAFRARGFEVGPFVGTSFSITATAGTFEKVLGVRIRRTPKGGLEFEGDAEDDRSQLSGDRLPEALRPGVQAIVFPPPPDFGPGTP